MMHNIYIGFFPFWIWTRSSNRHFKINCWGQRNTLSPSACTVSHTNVMRRMLFDSCILWCTWPSFPCLDRPRKSEDQAGLSLSGKKKPPGSQWGPAFPHRPGNTWALMHQVCYSIACGNRGSHLEYTCINYTVCLSILHFCRILFKTDGLWRGRNEGVPPAWNVDLLCLS